MSEDHDWVRRALADAGRADEPMPPDVADRLDRVLDELAGDPGADDGIAAEPAPSRAPDHGVVPMTRRRHRRWAGALLAAAAVTLGGYSLTATGVLEGLSGTGESEATADSAGGDSLSADEGAPEAATDGGAGARPDDGSITDIERGYREPDTAELASRTLRRDAARLASDTALSRALKDQGAAATDSREAPRAAQGSVGCVPPPASVRGARVAVTYDARPATAVVRRLGDGRADVQLWDCESPTRLARVVVR